MTPRPPDAASPLQRWAALGEVTVAFAAMHVGFRAIKRFTAWGRWELETSLNYSPGVLMIALTLALLVLHRRRFADYGLVLRPFFPSVNAGLLCVVMLFVSGAIVKLLGLPLAAPPADASSALTVACGGLFVTAILFWTLRAFPAAVDRFPRVTSIALLIGVFAVPHVAAFAKGFPLLDNALLYFALVVGAGVGEEFFFRGYIQSRVNLAFGRPWSFCGVPFGLGLLIAGVLFGLIHVLNTADYFTWQGRMTWWHGLATGASLYYGLLRERYGNLVAPILVHTAVNLGAHTGRLLGTL